MCRGLQRYRANFPPTRRGGEPIGIPALTPVVRSVVDRRNFSFVAFVARLERHHERALSSGCATCSSSFRELEVRLLLGEHRAAVAAD